MAKALLSKLDEYELVDETQDLRGRMVEDQTGTVLGRVEDLIVDTGREAAIAIVLANRAEYLVRDLELRGDRILVGTQTAPQGGPLLGTSVQSAGAPPGELRLPVIEERLRVGKRQVEQGGVRVSTQVHERPVQTQVHLREEHVGVVRRPADRLATAADLAAMEDRTLDVVERAEVPLVTKQARVVEEVVVKRDVAERREAVHETVRYSHIEVEAISLDPRSQERG